MHAVNQTAHPVARRLLPLVGVGILGGVLWALQEHLRWLSFEEVAEHVGRQSLSAVTAACLLMVCSFAWGTAMDAQALRYLGRALPCRLIALASFIGSALGNTTSFAVLSGACVRYRVYSAAGLSVFDIGKLMTFNCVTFWSGILCLAGAVLLLQRPTSRVLSSLTDIQACLLGSVSLGLVVAYLLWSATATRPLKLWRWEVEPPSPATALGQVALALAEWTTTAGVLLVLLPDNSGVGYWEFVAVFLLAQLGALVSQVPGGIGVFDGIVVVALSPAVAPAMTVAALLLYRGIYYLLPLAVAMVLWAIYEAAQRRAALRPRT